jgi:hypothetical protein
MFFRLKQNLNGSNIVFSEKTLFEGLGRKSSGARALRAATPELQRLEQCFPGKNNVRGQAHDVSDRRTMFHGAETMFKAVEQCLTSTEAYSKALNNVAREKTMEKARRGRNRPRERQTELECGCETGKSLFLR